MELKLYYLDIGCVFSNGIPGYYSNKFVDYKRPCINLDVAKALRKKFIKEYVSTFREDFSVVIHTSDHFSSPNFNSDYVGNKKDFQKRIVCDKYSDSEIFLSLEERCIFHQSIVKNIIFEGESYSRTETSKVETEWSKVSYLPQDSSDLYLSRTIEPLKIKIDITDKIINIHDEYSEFMDSKQ